MFYKIFRLFYAKRSYYKPRRSLISWNERVESPVSTDYPDEVIQSLPAAKIVQVLDGDTVIASINSNIIKIRLDSIDCPEDGQEWGDIAKYGLIKLIGGQVVFLEPYGLDHYNRTLATIFIKNNKDQWMNVNERMVTLGHAWVMRLYYDHLPRNRQAKLNSLERWARSKKVGLWAQDNPVPPWKWRQD